MQQHGSKYVAHRPSLPRPWGSKGQNSTFSQQCHVAYQIYGNHECSNMVANILPTDPPPPPPPDPGWWVKRPKFNISEHSHVAYQIKGNHICSNMANILPQPPPPPNPWGGVKR